MNTPNAPGEIEAGATPSAAYSAGRALLARWLRVPTQPPSIPPGRHSWARSFRPAEAYLRYLKLSYVMIAGFVGIFLVPLTLFTVGAMLAEGFVVATTLVIILVVIPGLLLAAAGYWALQLQFDTTWYVMTDRAIRIRTGIWVIRELTVTFENAQNVRVRRGPIQRWLGIGDVSVETASIGSTDQQGNTTASTALVAGVADPHAIRDRIVERMRASRSAGLGGDRDRVDDPGAVRDRRAEDSRESGSGGRPSLAPGPAWSAEHLAALREIREAVSRLP